MELNVSSETSMEENKNKARSRWAILRVALLGDTAHGSEYGERAMRMASIHSFPGFCLLERRQIDIENSGIGVDMGDDVIMGEKDEFQYETLEYKVPIRNMNDEVIVIRTRERRVCCGQSKVNVKALVSERYFGVDNTSNVKVWDSEGLLTFCMMRRCCYNHDDSASQLSSSSISLDCFSYMAIPNNNNLSQKSKVLRVIELGCGMAGLAGLAMALLENICHELFHDVQVQVLLTDGHPDAVKNNAICADINATALAPNQRKQQQQSLMQNGNIMTSKLIWKETEDGANECAQLTDNHTQLFRLLLVSDCLHFVNFHSALACTIGRLIDVNGLAILCQPHRGKSLEQFVLLIQAMNSFSSAKKSTAGILEPLFDVSLLHDYDDVVTKLHHQFTMQHKETYQPTTHYPLMLLLRKLRDYEEISDTQNAIEHVRQRTAAADNK